MKKEVEWTWKDTFQLVWEVVLELGILLLYGWVAQMIWNMTITEIFSAKAITYAQMLWVLWLYDVMATFSRRLNKTK